jgi:RNA-splicing ligase RtcB
VVFIGSEKGGNKLIELRGKYNTAKVFIDNVESETQSQIIELCNQDFVQGGKIRIMPDTHKGAGCVIGFTADLGDKIIPNIVGVDIGCGMATIELSKMDIGLEKLDNIIHQCIPSGRNTHEGRVIKFDKLHELYCYRELKDTKRIERSIGTLGGGNHFIEVNKDNSDNLYLVIHSGSRNLGKQVAEYYQDIAIDLCSGKGDYFTKRDQIIKECKDQGRKNEIQKALKELEKKYNNLHPSYPKELCFLTGEWRNKYLHDMNICQEYASLNRLTMAKIILNNIFGQQLHNINFNIFQTIHNYINFKDNIIRKGAISAYKDEKVLIPINMRDGSIIAIGKGNPDWNYSAPHGAGRLMSRSKAKELVDLEEFERTMEGIYTTSVGLSTLDESPMAYKSMQEILDNIGDTVDVIDIIKPIYNFKAGE